MELDWLKDFLALAQHGSFSRAADHRHVTQPAFSRRIRALEEWIGTELFVRGAQGAELTAAGVHFRPEAEELLRRIERARREAAAAGDRHDRSLIIAATHALSFTYFPGWIRRYVSLEGFGTLSLVSDSLAACEAHMIAGRVHLLLCHHHPEAETGLDARRFASIRIDGDVLVPVCAAGKDGRPAWPIPGEPTRPSRMLRYGPGSGLGRILAAHRAGADAADRVETVFTSDLAATLLTMACNGEGAAWLPLSLVEEEIAAGALARAGSPELDVAVEIRLFRSPDCRSKAADRLWEALCDERP